MARLGLLGCALISGGTLACVTRASPPSDAGPVPPVFSERDAEGEGGCPSLVDLPQQLFEGRLALSLPIGIEPLVEEAPEAWVVREQTAACAGWRPITAIVVTEQHDHLNLPVAVLRDQLLDFLALPEGLEITTREEDDAARRMTSVIAVPPEPQLAYRPRTILLAFRGGKGRLYVLMYETRADQFEYLLPSFEASLDSLRIAE